ncbi:hypothetical protein PSTT_10694 [Puccinia striiformis]|uniref:Uncharacterized protein n=1 Tax=Puccinia striiformis TaxID=27350 RepID=A0A2S4V3N1_9BASI|nr:hypothetical protein PSTT_10694 [Puccinia striiformis]
MLDSSKLPNQHQRHCRHFGDLVLYGFRRLSNKYHPTAPEPPDLAYIEDSLLVLSLDQVKTQRALANELLWSLLPRLQRQIISLSLAVDVSNLRHEPGTNLNSILQIQAELDHVMDHLGYVIATLCPEATTQPNQTDDHHLKEFKSYRLHRLKTKFQDVLSGRMGTIYDAASEIIQQMELSSTPVRTDCNPESLEKCFYRHVFHALDAIDVMKTVSRHLNWPLSKIHGTNLDAQSVVNYTNLTSPIFKLSRIFFTKLSKRGLTQERIPIYTEISSDQIENLAQSAVHVDDDLWQLVKYLSTASRGEAGVTSNNFIRIAESLRTRFDSPLLIVLMYFIPMIPDTDGLNVQKHYESWCVTWKTQMALAIYNFEQVANSFEGTP